MRTQVQEQVFVRKHKGLDLADYCHIELKGSQRNLVLTIYMDREGGINLDHCAEVSREVGTLLDVEDVIHTSYQLEVSSPGLDRPLKKPQDYERFAGKPVKIKTREKCDPDGRGHERKTFRGKLLGLDGDRIHIELEGKPATEAFIPLGKIEKANLELDF